MGCGFVIGVHSLSEVFSLKQELEDWRQSLPEAMTIRSATTIPLHTTSDNRLDPAERFRVILTLRFLHTQVLLHRPALDHALNLRMTSDHDCGHLSSWHTLQSSLIDECVQSSQELITILHLLSTDQREGIHLLGSWWFCLFYGEHFGFGIP